jgi:crotonobetainyl-CoA:carnitine CoA-transferase CaiB-like acyl-CoA transferase
MEPFKDFKGPDIVIMAMGGYMYLTGDADRAPLRVSCPQTYLIASQRAAEGAMIAHYYREITGEGQHVDTNALTCMGVLQMNAVPFWVLNKKILKRSGALRAGLSTSATQRQTWPCRDGFVIFSVYGGDLASRNIPQLLSWIESEGLADASVSELKERNWAEFDMAEADQKLFDLMSECFSNFFMKHTKKELYKGAVERAIMLYPVYTSREILEDPQLEAREYWVEIEHPELGTTIIYPGPFIKLSETPCTVWRRAPLIGEHNLEIYEGELRISREKLVVLKQAGVI